MRLNLERSSVVLAGAWNPAIFNDNWVATRVGAGQPVKGRIGLMLAGGGVVAQFDFPTFDMLVQPIRLQFKWSSLPPDLASVEAAAIACLDALPETPIQAVGVNFAFDVDAKQHAQVARVLERDDDSALKKFGAKIERINVQRMLTVGESTVNVLIAGGPATPLEVDLNHHTDLGGTGTARDAAKKLAGSLDRARAASSELLAKVYGLNLGGIF